MKKRKLGGYKKGVETPAFQNGGFARNNFFNRVFNRNNILEQQVRDEFGALKRIPLRKLHVDYASGDDADTLAQLHHKIEFIGPEEGVDSVQAGNFFIPKGKMLVNDDASDPRFISVHHPGQYTTMLNADGLSKQGIKDIVSNDFVSHALHGDPVYDQLNQSLEKLLMQKYGPKELENNGGVDAYIRGLVSSIPEYDIYKEEMGFVPQALKDNIVNYIKTGKTPQLKKGGLIMIKPSHRGRFTEWAKSQGMSVQQAARHVLSHKDQFSSERVKQAQFALNAAKFEQYGGAVGNMSMDGYKANSPDRFNPYNVIPSGNITMQHVPHPVLGIDNMGTQQVMHPGMNYQFPGATVLELPLRGAGGRYQQGGIAPAFIPTQFLPERPTTDTMVMPHGPLQVHGEQIDTAQRKAALDAIMGDPVKKTAYLKQVAAQQAAIAAAKAARVQTELDRRRNAMKTSDDAQQGSIFSKKSWTPENLHNVVQGTSEKMRFFPNDVGGVGELVDDYLNPFIWLGDAAKGLGESPLRAKMTNSVVPYFTGVASPLLSGAMGINPFDTGLFTGALRSKTLAAQGKNLLENLVIAPAVDYAKDKGVEMTKDGIEEVTKDAIEAKYKQTGGGINTGQPSLSRTFVDSVLNANKNLNFVDRYLHPDKYPIIKNPDGDFSTHRMMSSDNYVYPSIIQLPNKSLKQLSPDDAYDYAMRTGQFIKLKDEADAIRFAENGYKAGTQYKQDGGTAVPADPNYPIPTGYAPSTPGQRSNWNKFLDYLGTKGVAGSKDLDARDKSLGLSYLREYNKSNPDSQISEAFIPTVQYENYLIRKKGTFPGLDPQSASYAFSSQSPAYKERPISAVDNWLGSYTSKEYYPSFRRGTNFMRANGTSETASYDFNTNFEDYLRTRDGDPSQNDPLLEKYRVRQNGTGAVTAPVGTRKFGGSAYFQPGGMYNASNPDIDPNIIQAGQNPFFQNFLRTQNVATKDNPFQIGPTDSTPPFKIDNDTAAIYAAGQNPGMQKFFQQKSILSKDNQNPSGVNAPYGPPPEHNFTMRTMDPFRGVAAVAGMSFLNSALEANGRNKYRDWQRLRGMSDSFASVVPQSRGDYSLNEGYFRPDQQVPVQFRGTPVAQLGGGYFDAPAGPSIESLIGAGYDNIPQDVVASAPVNPPANSSDGMSSAVKPNLNVKLNQAARDAFDYYVNKKNLAPHVAAGIVGNLFQESGVNPKRLQNNGGPGRGIAQWTEGERWDDYLTWLKKNNKNKKVDPYDPDSQLKFVLEEPGWGPEALKAMKNTRTPEEAAYVFGKLYERPAEKYAAWDVRAGVARKLFDEYKPVSRPSNNPQVNLAQQGPPAFDMMGAAGAQQGDGANTMSFNLFNPQYASGGFYGIPQQQPGFGFLSTAQSGGEKNPEWLKQQPGQSWLTDKPRSPYNFSMFIDARDAKGNDYAYDPMYLSLPNAGNHFIRHDDASTWTYDPATKKFIMRTDDPLNQPSSINGLNKRSLGLQNWLQHHSESYQEGGEYVVTPKQLEFILKYGGEVEML